MTGHCLFPTDTLLGRKGVYFTSSVLGSLVYSMDSKNATEREEKQAKSGILGKDLNSTT